MAETSLPLEWNFANWEALEADIRNSAAHFGVEVPELVFEQLKQYYNTHFPVRASRMGVFMRFQHLYSTIPRHPNSRRTQQEESDDSPEEDEHSDNSSHVGSPLADEIPPADVNEVDGSEGDSSDAYDGDAYDSPTSFDNAYDDAYNDVYDDIYDDENDDEYDDCDGDNY